MGQKHKKDGAKLRTANYNEQGQVCLCPGDGSDCGCKLECFQNVNDDDKEWIIDRFNELGNYNLQNVYLRGLIVAKSIQRVGAHGMYGKADGEKPQKRKCSYEYWTPTKTLKRVKVESSRVLPL